MLHPIPALLIACTILVASASASSEQARDRPNILLLLVDDLKPALGCYGDRHARTPNLDELASRGLRFELAYCNQAVCAPSRFTLMLGAHSTTTGLYGLGNKLRRSLPKAVTMPQFFASHGYRTESLGKIFHIGHGNEGDPASFSIPHFHDKVIEYLDPASTEGGKLTREEAYFTNQQLDRIHSLPRGAAFESTDSKDEDYADGRVAAEAIRRLKAAKNRKGPFFMAVGFVRPHLPFSAPRKYWDLHDPARLPLSPHEEHPEGSPGIAHKRAGEIAMYSPVPRKNEDYTIELKRQLVHGYYASVSYMDAQVGKVIAELDRLELARNTIIVLWGDHGFHLGDLGIWTKHTNYEQANHIPLLLVAPGVTKEGSSTRQLAESVDLFPTLVELAGLPAPKVPQPLNGRSLVPVLRDPAQRIRDHAFHCYPRRGGVIGRAIRTERYRMVEWKKPGAPVKTAQYELYDYGETAVEQKNLARERGQVLARLKQILARYPEAAKR
jgi:iduronate 2-sulfatase